MRYAIIGEMMNLEERMVEVLGDFEAAHRAASVAGERFEWFYEQVLKEVEEHLARVIAEKWPESWREVEGDVKEACVRLFMYGDE